MDNKTILNEFIKMEERLIKRLDGSDHRISKNIEAQEEVLNGETDILDATYKTINRDVHHLSATYECGFNDIKKQLSL